MTMTGTPTFNISSDEIIVVNNGQFKLFLTFSNDNNSAISYFESNSSHFQYAKKEEQNQCVRFSYKDSTAIDVLCFLLNKNVLKHSPDIERNMIISEISCISRSSVPYKLKYTLLSDIAIPPYKTRDSDSGLDLNLVEKKYTKGNLTMFGTGLSIQPQPGYYFDLVPRSSIIKKGYILANNVGIIDQGYTGEVMVPLIKIDPDAPDLELPCRLMQLIPRKWYNFVPEETEQVTQTSRGDGGFGSTNK